MRTTNIFYAFDFYCLILVLMLMRQWKQGSSNGDCEVNENGKKAIGLD